MKLETSQRSEALQALENALPKSTLLCDTMSDNALAQVIGVLIDGNSLPASFIANALRMPLQATRFHLRILEEANLVVAFACGRHRYYEIVAGDTAERLENILGILGLPDRRSTCMRKNRLSPKPVAATNTWPARLLSRLRMLFKKEASSSAMAHISGWNPPVNVFLTALEFRLQGIPRARF